MKESLKEQLLDLIEKKLEGQLSDSEIKELEALVVQNPEAAKFYAATMQQHALLQLSADHMQPALGVEGEGSQLESVPLRSIFGIAALFFVGFCLLFVLYSTQEKKSSGMIAEIVSVDYATWGECSLPTAQGSELTAGRLKLLEGLATLKFTSGAEMVLEAPIDIELIDAMNTRLHSGIAVTEIPESAKGFTILTPTSKAIDHGTKFLTQVYNGGESTLVNVIEGEVEVVHAEKGSHHIFDGEMIKTTPDELTQRNFSGEIGYRDGMDMHEAEFRVSTADGLGDDGTAFRMNKRYHYDPQLIMLKNSDNEFNRKGYLKFDIRELAEKDFGSVSLDFQMLYSGWGSIALKKKETHFSVYAITNDTLDQWTGGLMNWEKAPANSAGSTELLSEHVQHLGSFILPRGKISGKISFSSEALNEVVRQDKNKLLSLVIIHESLGDQAGENYVYGIASKDHTSYLPPTLTLHQ